ncbi:hypothetical protein [Latilactobacillus sakei]|uniref:hypothetical protein n=1 Tax=Latilactobacillus sakei TaxID=1599 RepID=UPI00019CF8A8|nr:hypothetical protein [Latilactobacillus sakei]MCP8855208.1 hypothetical protein [Latilactobacillus sakei]GEP21141.1 hypothetical protein LSA03nite_07290 [Latilactobacillus sakei subsp. carnosus]
MKIVSYLIDIKNALQTIANCMQRQNPKPFDFDEDLVELIGKEKLKRVIARLDATYYEECGVLPDDYKFTMTHREGGAHTLTVGISKEYINERFNGTHFITEVQNSNQD